MREYPVQAAAPSPNYVDVVVPRRLHRAFTYAVPAEFRRHIVIGQTVIVPFGTRDVPGVVIALHQQPPLEAPATGLKSLRSCETASAHLLTSAQIELSQWVAERYAAPWGQCLKLVLPPIDQSPRPQVRYLPIAQGLDSTSPVDGMGEIEMRILASLRRRPKGVLERSLLQGDKSGAMAALRVLIKKGLILRRDEAVLPAAIRMSPQQLPTMESALPLAESGGPLPSPPPEARSWPMVIDKALARHVWSALLLDGERATRHWCLVQAAQAALRRGRRVLVITGDVENATRLAGIFVAAGERPLLLHSGLPGKEREAVWQAAQLGSASILVGTRMAVFAPLDRLGLVWVEGEDDTSLKEEQAPRYHAREVAHERACRESAVLVLASNHPSLESWAAVQQGLMATCVYRDRGEDPETQVIDLKAYGRDFLTGTVLTPPLCEGMREALQRRSLVVLFLNRKGFASVLHCGDCGAMPQCDVCSVALTFFRRRNQMRCHYCGRAKPVPDHCARCQSLKLEPVGSGTERIEEAVRRLFPLARVGRVDGETIRRAEDARAFGRLLDAGELDIVIGTQTLFRLALHVKAAFVAVPDADAGLHIPDFRSAERMYHDLVDAAELTLPARAGGRLFVQTRLPDHHAVLALASGNQELFLAQEQAFRQLLQYPPWACLIKLNVSGTVETAVEQAAHRWAALLRGQMSSVHGAQKARGPGAAVPATSIGATGEWGPFLILGPSPAPHAMVRGRYCWQILVKSDPSKVVRAAVVHSREELERASRRGGLRFEIDVDPVSMA
ncbi:MAG: primosomal protein N' [Nitrospira sp.]|nr:primosomal protein N' [Nitrospira sp.]